MSRVLDDSATWVRALARTNKEPIPWDRAVLAAIGIGVPIGVGLVFAGHSATAVGLGSLASMGALAGTVADRGDAGVERVRRIVLTSVIATLGFGLGAWVHGHAIGTMIAVIAGAVVSGFAGTISRSMSMAGLYFIMYVVTAANADFGLRSWWMAPLVFFCGAMWRLSLTAIVAALIGAKLSPERREVAAVYTAIAGHLAASGTSAEREQSAVLTRALNDAYDILVAARTRTTGLDVRWQSLVSLLNASDTVVDAVTAITSRKEPVDDAALVYLRGIAAWINDPRLDPPPAPDLTRDGPEATALADALDYVARVVGRATLDKRRRADAASDLSLPDEPTLRQDMARVGHALLAGGQTWLSVLQLVITLAVAQAVSLVLKLEDPYLVMVTVVVVMKPDLGSVFARAVQRGGGTLVGVIVASLVIGVVPHGPWQLLPVVAVAALMPVVMPRNYGLYSGVSAGLAVLLVELHADASTTLVETRLLDTLLGCAVVLLVGYLPWPSTWRVPQQLAAQISALARSVRDYASAALTSTSAIAGASTDATNARRAAYRRITDVRARVTQALAEPPAIRSVAASWTPEISALEAVADSITATAATAAASDASIDQDDIDRVCSELDSLADAIDGAHLPAARAAFTGALADLGDALTSARGALVSRERIAHSHRRRLRVHLPKPADTEQASGQPATRVRKAPSSSSVRPPDAK